jgi:phosphatidate phosphatase APP1
MLEDFMDHNGVPRGPLFLRDWSPLTLKGRTKRHKLAVIRQLITAYPELPFVLIGDSGEHDPEIYAEAVREHPGRIKAIYIRDVTTGSRRTAEVVAMARELAGLGTEMVVSSDTAAAAAHARESGLIAPQQAEATADEAEAASRD